MTTTFDTNLLKHLIDDDKPSEYLRKHYNELLESNFKLVAELKEVEQEKTYHPEGSVWNHVLMVVDAAAALKKYADDKEAFMLAAFLHDVGKKSTTTRNKKGRIISYNHDTVGAMEVEKILNNIDLSEEIKTSTIKLVSFHMHHIYILKNLPFGNVKKMIETVNIKDILLLFLADKTGRGNNSLEKATKEFDEISNIIEILNKNYHIEMKDISLLFYNIRKNMIGD